MTDIKDIAIKFDDKEQVHDIIRVLKEHSQKIEYHLSKDGGYWEDGVGEKWEYIKYYEGNFGVFTSPNPEHTVLSFQEFMEKYDGKKVQKFKVGDKVHYYSDLHKSERYGTVAEVYDKELYCNNWHNQDGSNLREGGAKKELCSLVEEPTTQNLIVHCKTQELHDKIVDKFGWDDGTKRDIWDTYKKDTAFNIIDGKIDCYCDLDYYQNNPEYKDYTFTTAEEVLGEVPQTATETLANKFREKYEAPEPKLYVYSSPAMTFSNWFQKPENPTTPLLNTLNKVKQYNTGTNTCVEPKKKFNMRTLSSALQRLFKGNLRKQYQAGLVNEDSSLTSVGMEVMFDHLSQTEGVQKALTEKANELLAEEKKTNK